MKPGEVRARLRVWRPDLEIRSLEPLAEGDFCRAQLLNESLVVRVPKHAEASRALTREACVLSRIGHALPLEVPEPTNVADPSTGHTTLSIHEMIPGQALTRERWRSLRDPARIRSARELGGFLAALHRLDPGAVNGCGLERVEHEDELQDLVRRLEGSEGDFLSEVVRSELLGRFHENAERAGKRSWEPSIVHADVSPEHVLVDVAAGELTGVIDWGDVVIGDPARDFIFLYEDWGSDFLDLALDGYGLEAKDDLLYRVHLRYLADQLEWTLDAGREGRREDVEHGAAELRRAQLEFDGGDHD